MERDNAINILKSRKVISGPGKYSVKITSATPYHRSIETGPDQVAIVNFNTMTPYHKETAATLFAQGDYQEAVNQNLTTSIREGDYMPTKGEIVDIVVEEITTNNGVKGLFVTGPCVPKKAEAPAAFDIEGFLGKTEGVSILEESEEEIPAFQKADTSK